MYGLKYIVSFENIVNEDYTMRISYKDYEGTAVNVTGGDSIAVQKWTGEGAFQTIRGCTLQIKLINQGALPLSEFYSEEDDGVLVELFRDNAPLFRGYVLQDESAELLVDYAHEINLLATDSIGLLKDVPFDKSFTSGYFNQKVNADVIFDANTLTLIRTKGLGIGSGTAISVIPSSGGGIETYNVVSVAETTENTIITIDESFDSPFDFNCDVFFVGPFYPKAKQNLLSFLQCALLSTNLYLPLNVYARLNEVSQDFDKSFLETLYLDPLDFYENETWKSCYDVLETILKRFNAILFQARGEWQILRWFDIDYTSDFEGIKFTGYDGREAVIKPNNFTMGIDPDTDNIVPINGVEQRVERPFKFVKETFKYQTPTLPINADLINFENLASQRTTGTGQDLKTYKRYNPKDLYKTFLWVNNNIQYQSDSNRFFIEIVYDYLDNEIERYVYCVRNPINPNTEVDSNLKKLGCMFSPFEVVKDDVIQIKGSFKMNPGVNLFGTIVPPSFAASLVFSQNITLPGFSNATVNNGISQLALDVNGTFSWNSQYKTDFDWNGWVFDMEDGSTSDWKEFTLTSPKMPYNALAYLRLHFYFGANEAFFKNIKTDIKYRIGGNINLTGQTHTQTQIDNIKNKQEEDISIDTSPRNSIKGTLFIQGYDGAINKRALAFAYADDLDGKTLGDLITREDLKFNYVPRMIVDGDFYTTQQVNPLFAVEYSQFPSKIFNFGLLEIDYRNCRITSQIYERQDNNEKEFNTDYEFKYLSENT